MSIIGSNVLAGASGQAGAATDFQVERSLRFDSSSSTYLSRTPSSAGNRRTWTWSAWVKKGEIISSGRQRLFSVRQGTSDAQTYIQFRDDNKLYVEGPAIAWLVNTDAIFRDPGAWGHVVVAFDTTQSTASNRVRIYWNGVEQSLSGTFPTQNYADSHINNTILHSIGNEGGAVAEFFNGYLAEIHHVDGQQLTASDFAEYDSNNVWQPKDCKDDLTYGTNGFYLKFADNTSNSGLGTDSSGNSHNFTVNNLIAKDAKWSNYLTTTGTFVSNQGPEKSFDNSLAGADVPALNGGQTLTWSPPGGLAYSSKVEIYVGAISGFTYSLNGASAVTATTNAWNTVDTGSGTINTLVFDRGVNETHGPHAIRVDNVVLVDGNAANTDSVIDTPTNYDSDAGNNRGNYATLNPLHVGLSSNGGVANSASLSDGNLRSLGATGKWGGAIATMAIPASGKWYFEFQCLGANTNFGLSKPVYALNATIRDSSTSRAVWYGSNGQIYYNIDGTTTTSSSASTYTTNDIIGIAVDSDAFTVKYYKNNTLEYTQTLPSTLQADLSAGNLFPSVDTYSGTNATVDFGQQGFAFTPPSNYKSLCTQNLSDPPIADGSTAMDVSLWTGNGTSQTISGLNHSPDLVWVKARSFGADPEIYDIVRGAGKRLYTSLQNAESSPSSSVNSFTSDGFTVTGGGGVNNNTSTYVGWTWDAGSSTVSNTDGSITSQVRASQTNGFSIITYSGTGSNATVGHGLNAKPDFYVVKTYSTGDAWMGYHSSQGATKFFEFTSGGFSTGSNRWNDTEPTSSVISLGTEQGVNGSGRTHVAYLWTSIPGFSSIGSYQGNGSADGPFIFTGFRVRYLLQKRVDSSGSWAIKDAAREPYNVVDTRLYADGTNADMTQSSFHEVDFLSNGFKVRSPGGSEDNASGGTFVYLAFASHPFKTARAR